MKTIKLYSYDELNRSAKASAYRTMAADHNFMIKQELAECAKVICNSSDESAATIAENLEGNHFRDRVYVYDQPEVISDIYEAMVNSDIQIVDVSKLTHGDPIDFDTLEPYQDDIDVNPDNGHIIALTSFISHFYE